MALTLMDPETGEDRPDQRDKDRPEDREDETDVAIKGARLCAVDAVQYLGMVLHDHSASAEDRSRAAIALLEVAGCL